MILADIIILVDYFRGSRFFHKRPRRWTLVPLIPRKLSLGDLILVEILQGIRPGHEERLVKSTLAST